MRRFQLPLHGRLEVFALLHRTVLSMMERGNTREVNTRRTSVSFATL